MNGFDKTRRLLKKSDYDYVFAQAKKVVTSEFIFLYRNNSLGYARLGLALSKKIIPKAHDRNRLKRLLRETFRVNPLPAIDVIVLARPGVANVENKVMNTKLGKTWAKLIALSAT
ncbi:ribonuclease P protein component [Legionella clemsonensis]|uniref:Ribonuclease P protein component n=1 Tax=Legionella clemsonensis TaxID=1867846 RepID=A0A222NYC3_9GAMM|nr:ribonuclease P protein component [Legionella clemsonensis]ASQ44576.1 Ribonuclease P protein component [Legionella clemsonensis]